jgi:tetratricopeptide (TPR) repeat protein
VLAASGARAALDQIGDLPRKTRIALFTAQEKVQGVNFQGAVDVLLDFLKDEPDNDHFWIRFFIADYYAHLDNIEEAYKHFERCVELEPRFAQGWLKLGETAYSLERYERAAEAILEGYKLSEPHDQRPELLYYGAASYILAGLPERAIPALETLISGDQGEPRFVRFEWFRAMVSASIEAKELEKGQAAIDKMLKRFPDKPDAWYLAFQYGASTADYTQAAVALTVVGYLRELTRREQIQLGDLYSVVGVPVVASDYYQTAMSDSASAQDIERLASAYIASHENDTALEILAKAVSRESTPRLWSLMGDLRFMRKEYALAYAAFAKCAALEPNQGRPYLMMGYCAMELERYEDAIAQLERAVEFEDLADRATRLLERARRKSAQARANPEEEEDGATTTASSSS